MVIRSVALTVIISVSGKSNSNNNNFSCTKNYSSKYNCYSNCIYIYSCAYS